MKRAATADLKIDVLVESEHWQNAGAAKAIIRRALKQAAATVLAKAAELAIVLTDDAAMRGLNRNWRGVDAATNVLAFPVPNVVRRSSRRPADRANGPLGPGAQLGDHLRAHPQDQMAGHLGDIVLAYETVEREARRDGKPFDHHLAHLVVHGFLHLLGYDHRNDAQARRMETTERAILCDLAVPDPYRPMVSPGRQARQRAAKAASRKSSAACRECVK